MVSANAANISGADVKLELIERRPKGEGRLAVLSGFVRTRMSFYKRGRDVDLWLDCQSEYVKDYIAALMMEQFKITPSSNVIDERDTLVFAGADKILRALEITDADSGLFEPGKISKRFYNDVRHYARGVFFGCGSLSAPNAVNAETKKASGYHLEFAISTESFANEFIQMLAAFNIYAHLTLRSGKYIVYVKDSTDVSDCLALIGAEKTVIRLNEAVAALDVKNGVVRRVNCEVANMSRTIAASVPVIDAIAKLERHGALEPLGKKVVEAAQARMKSPTASLGKLAAELGISKSALKYRLDAILAAAGELDGDR